MTKLRFILSILSILVGVFILTISLSSASQVYGQNENISDKKFYLAQKILPDNILYPVAAGIDKIRLEVSTPEERSYIQAEYARRRLDYTQELLRKDKRSLAHTTLTKSQKYINLAVQEALDNQNTSLATKKFLAHEINYQVKEVKRLLDCFSPQEKNILNQISRESQVLAEKINQEIK